MTNRHFYRILSLGLCVGLLCGIVVAQSSRPRRVKAQPPPKPAEEPLVAAGAEGQSDRQKQFKPATD